jgi:hypothetical protein
MKETDRERGDKDESSNKSLGDSFHAVEFGSSVKG